jgi:hypothetical protein
LWREELRDRLNLTIIAANNHHAGFGLGTANTFRKMLDLSEVTWNDVKVPEVERAEDIICIKTKTMS